MEPGLSAQTCYVDTSVGVALPSREPTAPHARAVLQGGWRLLTADWTEVEVASALAAKARRGDFAPATAAALRDAYRDGVRRGGIDVVAGEGEDFSAAAGLCQRVASGLRAGDALHLALAWRRGCTLFFGFDRLLNRNARALGLGWPDEEVPHRTGRSGITT